LTGSFAKHVKPCKWARSTGMRDRVVVYLGKAFTGFVGGGYQRGEGKKFGEKLPGGEASEVPGAGPEN